MCYVQWGKSGEGKGTHEKMHLKVVEGQYSMVRQSLQFCIQKLRFVNSLTRKYIFTVFFAFVLWKLQPFRCN